MLILGVNQGKKVCCLNPRREVQSPSKMAPDDGIPSQDHWLLVAIACLILLLAYVLQLIREHDAILFLLARLYWARATSVHDAGAGLCPSHTLRPGDFLCPSLFPVLSSRHLHHHPIRLIPEFLVHGVLASSLHLLIPDTHRMAAQAPFRVYIMSLKSLALGSGSSHVMGLLMLPAVLTGI